MYSVYLVEVLDFLAYTSYIPNEIKASQGQKHHFILIFCHRRERLTSKKVFRKHLITWSLSEKCSKTTVVLEFHIQKNLFSYFYNSGKLKLAILKSTFFFMSFLYRKYHIVSGTYKWKIHKIIDSWTARNWGRACRPPSTILKWYRL